MASGADVLNMLLPDGGWYIAGDEYEGIEFINCESITKKQFTDGFAQYDAWKLNETAAQATAKTALLERLGITEDEAKLLLA